MDNKSFVDILNEALPLSEAGNKLNNALATANNALDTANNVYTYITSINSRNTIRDRSANLVLNYPNLFSRGISSDYVSIINKALDHEYISLLLIIMNNRILTQVETDGGDTASILKQFHTNIDDRRSVFNDVMNAIKTEDANLLDLDAQFLVESINYEFRDGTDKELEMINEENMIPIEEILNESIINRINIPNVILNEAKNSSNNGNKSSKKKKTPSNNNSINNQSNNNTNNNQTNSDKKPKENKSKAFAKIDHSNVDYKKLNSLSPTIITAKLLLVPSKDGKPIQGAKPINASITFGVKSVIHPLDSDDIILNLGKLKDPNFFVRLCKWLTGEIKFTKFFSDVIFNASNEKERIIREKNGSSYWWNKLKNLSKSSKIRNATSVSKISAVTTLVITKLEVDAIKNKYGIDYLSNSKAIDELLNELYLLGFIIVDESSDIIYMYNETKSHFEMYTSSSLKAFSKDEISMSANGSSNSLYK